MKLELDRRDPPKVRHCTSYIHSLLLVRLSISSVETSITTNYTKRISNRVAWIHCEHSVFAGDTDCLFPLPMETAAKGCSRYVRDMKIQGGSQPNQRTTLLLKEIPCSLTRTQGDGPEDTANQMTCTIYAMKTTLVCTRKKDGNGNDRANVHKYIKYIRTTTEIWMEILGDRAAVSQKEGDMVMVGRYR